MKVHLCAVFRRDHLELRLGVAAGIKFLALRIRFEEHFLRRELTGYDGYAARVRYRLIPFLW